MSTAKKFSFLFPLALEVNEGDWLTELQSRAVASQLATLHEGHEVRCRVPWLTCVPARSCVSFALVSNSSHQLSIIELLRL